MEATDILHFWFEEIEEKQHWIKDPQFDDLIKERFLATHKKARLGELWSWRETPEGRLAEVIVLDQFSRNIFRDTPLAFSQDPMALTLSQAAIQSGDDLKLEKSQRFFLYMPFMHSESLAVHEEGLKLFQASGMNTDYEIAHMKIITRFGRYPHRNEILGRESSPEELEFLEQPGSSF